MESYDKLRESLDAACAELVRKYQIVANDLTERQLADALRQAIAAGDFACYVERPGGGQAVVYVPFRELELLREWLQEARAEIAALRAKHDDYGDDD